MSNQNPSRRHHHAPQFFLARWAGPDGQLWYYKRVPTGKLVDGPVHPRSTGFEPDLYSTPPAVAFEDWAPDIIERQVMSPIDDAAAKALVKLTNVPPSLNEDERRSWATFLNSLLERHPNEIFEREEKAVAVGKSLLQEWRDRYAASGDAAYFDDAIALADVPLMARNMVRTAMVQQINGDGFVRHLLESHVWSIVEAGAEPFITSDRPIVVNASSSEARPIHFITLPLGPKHLFVSYPKAWASDPELDETLRLLTASHNLIVALQPGIRYLYAAAPIVDGPVIRLRTAIDNAFPRTAKGDP